MGNGSHGGQGLQTNPCRILLGVCDEARVEQRRARRLCSPRGLGDSRGIACSCPLHSPAQAKKEVQGRLLLNVVVS